MAFTLIDQVRELESHMNDVHLDNESLREQLKEAKFQKFFNLGNENLIRSCFTCWSVGMEKIRRENAQDRWQKKVRALTDEVLPLRKMKEEFKVLKGENAELWRKVEQMQALLKAVQIRANDAVHLAAGDPLNAAAATVAGAPGAAPGAAGAA